MFAVIIVFASCGLPDKPASNESGSSGIGDTVIEVTTDLFKPDTDNPKEIRMRTNDEKYLKKNGLTLWTAPVATGSTFEPVEVTVKKISGYNQAGYGVVFCKRNEGGEYGICLLTVLVNVTGEYTIGKVVNGRYTNIQWWQPTGKIAKGYDRENTLQITRDPDSGVFTLSINGTKECEFTDMTEPYSENGDSGYAVVISPYEIFPLNSVSVVFTEKR